MKKDQIERMISATKSDNADGSGGAGDVGQGELYSPDHAIKIATTTDANPNFSEIKTKSGIEERESSSSESETKQSKRVMMVAVNLRAVKDKVMEKLSAAAVPSEAVENARQFLEGVVRDVATAAQGLTKEALHRIKTHLVDVLPSLSPAVTRKMVDDAEKEVNKEVDSNDDNGSKSKEDSDGQLAGKSPYVSPASSFFGSLTKPFSRL